MSIIVSNSSQLINALKTANGGETIILKSGDYGSVTLSGLKFDSRVTIKSENPNSAADFQSLKISNCSNLAVDSVHIDTDLMGSGSPAANAVYILNSNNVEFVNSEINGVENRPSGVNPWSGYAVHIENSTDVLVENNDIHDIKIGIYAHNSSDIELIANEFNEMGSDNMKFSGIDGMLIENNIGSKKIYKESGAHNDFIQFQGTNSQNVDIIGNVYIAGRGNNAQGIFLDDAYYSNFHIENNFIYTDMVRGISVSAGENFTVINNTVLSIAGSGNKSAGILISATNSTLADNISNVTKTGVTGVGYNKPGVTSIYNDYYPGLSKGYNATLDDMAPKPGSIVDYGSGLGAEERINEILNDIDYIPGEGSGSGGGDDDIPVDDGPVLPVDYTGIGKLVLAETTTDKILDTAFVNGEVISADLASQKLTLILELNQSHPAAGKVAKVQFNLDNGAYTRTEAKPPYVLFGDAGTGAYYDGQIFAAGGHTIKISYLDSAGNVLHTEVTDFSVGEPEIELPNTPPIAIDDLAVIDENTSVTMNILANDGDEDGDVVSLVNVSNPNNGTVVMNDDGTITYTPDADFHGTNTMEYVISDGRGGTNIGYAGVIVRDVVTPIPNNAPVAANDSVILDEDTRITLNPLLNDTDKDGDNITITDIDQPKNGLAVLNPDGTVTYTPTANYNGTDSFTYHVTDGKGGVSSATVNLNIKPVDEVSAPLSKISLANSKTDMIVDSDFKTGDYVATALAKTMTVVVGLNEDNPLADKVSSVRFVLDGGKYSRTEKEPPFALFGDKDGDFNIGKVLGTGEHSLEIKYLDSKGKVLASEKLDFTVGEQPAAVSDSINMDLLLAESPQEEEAYVEMAGEDLSYALSAENNDYVNLFDISNDFALDDQIAHDAEQV